LKPILLDNFKFALKGMFLLHWSRRLCNNKVFSKDSGLYVAIACAYSCH